MNWGDLALEGLSWAESGRDLILNFSRSGDEYCLELRWARGLQLTIENEANALGSVLSWDGKVLQRDEDGAWEIEIDFAFDGRLFVVCDEVSLTMLDPNGGHQHEAG